MAGKFSIMKFFSGFVTGSHWGKTVSFLLSAGCILFVGFAIWKAYVKLPDPRTDQRAETIDNYYHQPKATFGCATVKTYEKFPTNRSYHGRSMD